MVEDESVIVLGEDVGKNGGVFRATDGLVDRFDTDRVRDTPLSEAMIAGLPVGLSAMGFRPVAEIQFMGFIYPVIDQLVNHASRMRTRTRGRLTCPMVVRAPYGGGVQAPEHHSESMEAMFAHIPGLRVIIPSSPAKAYGLLLAAIRDPDPVVFLEPKRIYRVQRERIVDDGSALPLDRAFLLREGTDVTLIGWGAALREILEAADALSGDGIDAEVIDVRNTQTARCGHYFGLYPKDRTLRHRSRSSADLGVRCGNRGADCGRGSDEFTRTHRTRNRLGHHNAAVSSRGSLYAVLRSSRCCRATRNEIPIMKSYEDSR